VTFEGGTAGEHILIEFNGIRQRADGNSTSFDESQHVCGIRQRDELQHVVG
jgi:hypothetical protein